MSDERSSAKPAANSDPTPRESPSGGASPGDIYSGRESHKKSLGKLTSRERIARSRRRETGSPDPARTSAEAADLYQRDDHRPDTEQDAEARRSARRERRLARKRRKRVRTTVRVVAVVVPILAVVFLVMITLLRDRSELEAGLGGSPLSLDRGTGPAGAEAASRGSLADEEMGRINRLRRAKEFELDAWRFIRAGDLDSALEKVNAAIERCPDLVSLRFTRGKVLYDLGRFEEALSELRQAVEGDPSSPAYFAAMGACYLKLDDHAAAAVCLETAVGLNPEMPETLSQLGSTWLQLGLEDRALAALQRAAELNPQDPGVLALLAEAELLRGWTDRAVSTARSALDLDPAEATALFALARAYARLGSADHAVATLTLAYDRVGASSVARWLGSHDFASLRTDPAFQQFSRWIAAESFRDGNTGEAEPRREAPADTGPATAGLRLQAPDAAVGEPTLRIDGGGQSAPRTFW